MEKSGDVRSAFLILRPFVQNKTAGAEIYREYVKLLTQAGKTEEVRSVLKSADIEIQNACAEYICETPVANLESGTYTVAPNPGTERKLLKDLLYCGWHYA